MRRAWVVASVEFRAFVRTRSFLIGLLFPLLLVGASLAVERLSKSDDEAEEQVSVWSIAVIDRSGSLYETLEAAAAQQNRRGVARAARHVLVLEPADPGEGRDGDALLVRQVQEGELAAVVEIPADADTSSDETLRLRVVARAAVESELGYWLESAIREELRMRALRRSGISNQLRAQLGRSVVASFEAPAPAEGEASAVAPDPGAAPTAVQPALHQLGAAQKLVMIAPLGLILLVATSLSAAPLFQAVLEEKTNRISEILLSSISTFELMLGKLLGSLAACSIAAVVYGGLLLVVVMLVFGAAIPPALLLLFAVYLVLSLLFWGSIFLAVGAACADTKDAQNLMLPIALFQVLPMIFMSRLLQAPDGALARGLSIFPPTAPITMFIRLSRDPAPQAADIALSLVLLAAAAALCLWAASRVLRVGLLAHGRSASWREILHWVRTG